MKEIKVSVLVYVLNDEKYIEKCIRSVMAQTLKEIEILVIDGGSRDGTLNKVRTLMKKDDRIRIIHSGAGVGLQFNTGLKNALGKYIGVCESDDYIAGDMYARQYEIAEKYDLDFLKANVNRFCETEKQEYLFPFRLSENRELYERVLNPQEDKRVIKLGVSGFWSGLYRRDFLIRNDIFMNETGGASYQDIAFSFLTAAKAKRVYFMEESFYYYRMDNPNSSVNNPNKISILINEYNLLKKRLLRDEIFEEYKETYLSWKIDGHLWFYRVLSNGLKDTYAELMYDDIKNELEEMQYKEILLTPNQKKVVQKLSGSQEVFVTYINENFDHSMETKEAMDHIGGHTPIIIFGCGNLGKIVARYLQRKNKNIAAFVDNNKKKWGENVAGLEVLKPEEAGKNYKEAKYIVASAEYYQDICSQLKDMHIENENIVVCNNYDWFLKHVLIQDLKMNG